MVEPGQAKSSGEAAGQQIGEYLQLASEAAKQEGKLTEYYLGRALVVVFATGFYSLEVRLDQIGDSIETQGQDERVVPQRRGH